ncbi:coiled-coil domain-containing protein 88B isoform X2 [Hemicordylus capensis]|nr:coiled-coil domain-containing protein 88B isoform X2 [Hemicordylus capensis]
MPPNVHLLARDPLTAQAVGEMKKLLLLLLGSAVQCERRDKVIAHIQTLDLGTQAALAAAIQQVTQEPENVLRLQWKESGPSEAEQLLQIVVSRVGALVHERDGVLEQLWALQQQEPGAPRDPPPETHRQHLGVQLAEARAQVWRLQQELAEKVEELLDQQDELKDLEGQFQKTRQENRTLAGEARLAGLYRDELDALREKALRTDRLQAELTALRERLPSWEQCRVQLQEEREFSQALLETKAVLEGQLEAARARGHRLSQLEKEKRQLQSCLHRAQEEREQLCRQTEELLRENLVLERQLRRSLGEPLDVLRAEELETDWIPNELSEEPVLLNCEVGEAGRLLSLERENQALRRKLQEALEDPGQPGSAGLEPQEAAPESRPPEAGEAGEGAEASERQERGPEGQDGAPERQALEEAAQALGAALREAELQQEAESHRAAALEERLRGLQEVQAEALQQREREAARHQQEAAQLLEEVQALEREREALRAGAQALQAAATRAELELGEARRALQGERLEGARLAQRARQAEEELREARRELESLQRGLEQHKVALAQLQAEKGALEEALGRAEAQRRQLDKDGRRLQAQAQEEALAAQGLRLAQLEAQSRQQATELSTLQEASQRLGEQERQNAGLREQLDAQGRAVAIAKEELQREKGKAEEREATLAQLREQLLKKEEHLKEAMQTRCGQQQTQEEPEGLSPGKKLAEDNSALRRQLEELRALNQQLTSGLRQAKSSAALPRSPEEPSVSWGTEGQGRPDPQLLPPLQADARREALSARLIEVERQNATLQAEKSALTARLGQLEGQVGDLQGRLQDLQSQSAREKEESRTWLAQNSTLQAEAAALRSQQASLDTQVSELRQRLASLEAEARGAQQEREGWRERYAALLRDHDRLALLHERQGVDLEGLLGKHAGLKGALRGLEQEHRELQGRHSQLLGQKAGLEQQEQALRKQTQLLEGAEGSHRQLTEQHGQLKEDHERLKQTLAQTERALDDLQGELQSSRNRVTSLQLEQARLEAESSALKEQNQQLDATLGRLSTQCELLAQLKGNQEEENRHLLDEIQALSRENRRLLERSMESREHFQEEQRQYLDKLGELRREKQKLVEKIMDQYRVLEPALPRGKKSNWITEKIRKLMKPRREAPHEQLRPMAEGAGSSESLTEQEGPRSEGAVRSTPGSPLPLPKASSTLSLVDSQQMQLRRHRLSSRLPALEPSGEGDGLATPRQRFRQRRLGMLGGSREEAAVAGAEWEVPSQMPSSSREERGPPLGEEEPASQCPL